MVLISKGYDLIKRFDENREHALRNELVNYLKALRQVECQFWGVSVNQLASGEEELLEGTNHIIHLLIHEHHEELKSVLALREVRDFLDDIKKLKEDVQHLKKLILKSNKLRNYISSYTIKLVDQRNYAKMKNIFILEKQLYDVLDIQDREFEKLLKEIQSIKFSSNEEKVKTFLDKLYKARDILAGHMDHHGLWEEEREGYSNTSNILTALIEEMS